MKRTAGLWQVRRLTATAGRLSVVVNEAQVRQLHVQAFKAFTGSTVVDGPADRSLFTKLGRKLGLNLNLLSPTDKQAVLRTLTLMADDAALKASFEENLTGSSPVPYEALVTCPTCGGTATRNQEAYLTRPDRVGIASEYALRVKRRVLAMMSNRPGEKPMLLWSRALDAELLVWAGEELEYGIDPFALDGDTH